LTGVDLGVDGGQLFEADEVVVVDVDVAHAGDGHGRRSDEGGCE
jgi:hypothetical protein